MRARSSVALILAAVGGLAAAAASLAGCPGRSSSTGPKPAPLVRALHRTPLAELNDGACKPGQRYVQEPLREPMQIAAAAGLLETELVVALRKRCVPVWVPSADKKSGQFEMQTLASSSRPTTTSASRSSTSPTARRRRITARSTS